MKIEDFEIAVIDRAIEIVRNRELNYAYSCFAIERAVKELVSPHGLESVQYSDCYCDFAHSYFSSCTEDESGDFMPYWWSTDGKNRHINERVEFMTIFRNHLLALDS